MCRKSALSGSSSTKRWTQGPIDKTMSWGRRGEGGSSQDKLSIDSMHSSAHRIASRHIQSLPPVRTYMVHGRGLICRTAEQRLTQAHYNNSRRPFYVECGRVFFKVCFTIPGHGPSQMYLHLRFPISFSLLQVVNAQIRGQDGFHRHRKALAVRAVGQAGRPRGRADEKA